MLTPTPWSSLLPQRVELPEISADDPPPGAAGTPMEAAAVPAKPAVYAILDQAHRPILLSSTANLRLGLLRRFSPPPFEKSSARRVNYRQISRWVDYRQVSSTFAANLWYLRAARLLYPDSYRRMLSWKPAWCIAVNADQEFPQLLGVPVTRAPMGQALGPFPDSASARLAIHVLEDTFDLCRYYDILRQAPHGKPCAYKQMGKCPAPCDGSIDMVEYRQSIRMAVEFLVGREASSAGEALEASAVRQAWRQGQEMQMRSAAAKLDFLAAARIKSRISAVAGFSDERLAYVQRLSKLNFLILQPGQSPLWMEPFFFQAGRIRAGQPVQKKRVHEALADWCNQINTPVTLTESSGDDPSDLMSLLCYHLFRSRDSGLYIAADQSVRPESIMDPIAGWCSQKQRPADSMEQSSDAAGNSGPEQGNSP